MPRRTESNISLSIQLHALSNRLIIMSLNIHIELTAGHFSFSRSQEIRQHSDRSVIDSSRSNPLIEELLTCIEYYCRQVMSLADELRAILAKNAIEILDDLSKGSQLCL